jgi:hypothetical protein
MHNKGTKISSNFFGRSGEQQTNQSILNATNYFGTSYHHLLLCGMKEIWAQMEKGVELALDQKARIN